jgi:hypothetical protein
VFNDNTVINRAENYVYDIAQDVRDQLCPVRLEASRAFVKDVWGIDWSDEKGVRSRFDREKAQFLGQLESRAHDDYNSIAVFRIG